MVRLKLSQTQVVPEGLPEGTEQTKAASPATKSVGDAIPAPIGALVELPSADPLGGVTLLQVLFSYMPSRKFPGLASASRSPLTKLKVGV